MKLRIFLYTGVAIASVSIPLSASSPIGQIELAPYGREISTLSVLPDGAPAEFNRHGRRPRIPGSSGCEDPHDIAEHPECIG